MSKLIDEYEINNARQSLQLLRNQIANGRIEKDFSLRHLDKIVSLMDRMEGVSQAQSGALRFEALYNVSRILGTSLDQQTVLEQVMDAIIQLTGAESGFVMLRDDDGNLQVQVARNFDQQTLNSSQLSYSRTITSLVIDSGEGILTSNALEDPRFAAGASIMSMGMRSIMACPLRARGLIIGVAYVENRVVAGLFSPEDLSTLEALAGQASVAIDNARLFSATDQELSRVIDELRELRRIDLRLNEKLDPNKALQFTLESACKLSGASRGYIGLLQGEPLTLVTAYQWPDSIASMPHLDAAYPQVVDVLEQGTTQSFSFEQNHFVFVPIKREKTVIGLLVLKRDQDEMTADRIDLVERVAVRAAVTIENARLYAAVQAADKAKTEFVGVVAHDLKAPMTSIQGYADLLLMQTQGLNERQISFLERISNTVRRMEMLVSDLADISRMESGHFLLNETRVSVDSVIEAVRDQTTPQIQAHRHVFNIEIESNLPALHTDFYRIVQILTNLVSNAYKYTPDGGTITLCVEREGARVRFSVADTGIGLSEDSIRKLGTKFWRAEDSFTRSQPGTGLGYAITSSIVEQMGSHVKITSELGAGSMFAFSIAALE